MDPETFENRVHRGNRARTKRTYALPERSGSSENSSSAPPNSPGANLNDLKQNRQSWDGFTNFCMKALTVVAIIAFMGIMAAGGFWLVRSNYEHSLALETTKNLIVEEKAQREDISKNLLGTDSNIADIKRQVNSVSEALKELGVLKTKIAILENNLSIETQKNIEILSKLTMTEGAASAMGEKYDETLKRLQAAERLVVQMDDKVSGMRSEPMQSPSAFQPAPIPIAQSPKNLPPLPIIPQNKDNKDKKVNWSLPWNRK